MDVASPLLRRACAALDTAGVRWAVLRGAAALASPAARQEIDLLVDQQDVPRLRAVLAPLGFRPRRAWGHAPHRFLDALDNASATQLTLDVVDRLRYGRPVRSLAVEHARAALAARTRLGELWTLEPADEFATLLLHALLDKPSPPAEHRMRLSTLWLASVAAGTQAQLLSRTASLTGGALPGAVLVAALESNDWALVLALRPRLRRRLFRHAPLATIGREVRGRAGRAGGALVRRLLRMASPHAPPAPRDADNSPPEATAPAHGRRLHG
jgi:hypothetical protein